MKPIKRLGLSLQDIPKLVNMTRLSMSSFSPRELFKVSQHGSGADLTTFLIEIYENIGIPVEVLAAPAKLSIPRGSRCKERSVRRGLGRWSMRKNDKRVTTVNERG
jgi:hypothetical protein